MNPWLILVFVAVGWLMFMFANDSMILEQGKIVGFAPTPLAWELNLGGMALFIMGVLVLNTWCETRLKYLHKAHEIQKTIMEE